MPEHIMEHIAHEVGRDPLSVRLKNTMKTDPTELLVESIKKKSDFDKRKSAVEDFNKVSLIVKDLFRFPSL